jgi:hypothetical protein
MVQVRVDGIWRSGFVRAQEMRDGVWVIHVQYEVDGANYFGGFAEEDVRGDETDYSRGRG